MLRPLLLVACLLLSGCGGHSDATATGALPAGTGVLRGVVVDDAIRPMPGASVEVHQGGGVLRNATSGANGQFLFRGLPPGSYFVNAQKPHYRRAQLSAAVVADVAEPPALRIQLTALQGELAFYTQFKIRGFMECAGLGGNWCFIANYYPCYAERTAGQPCSANITSDNSYFRLDHQFRDYQRVPDWTQVELVWRSTQDVFDYLQMRADLVGPNLLIDSANSTYGPSPLQVNLNHTYAQKWSLGVNRSLALESFSSGNAACNTNPTAAPYLCVIATATVNQDITYYVHAFYGYRPPLGWHFTSDGMVPPPPG
jgi:hypothetical protein